MQDRKPIGLIAGSGDYPRFILEAAHQEGYEVAVYAVDGEAVQETADLADRLTWGGPGYMNKMIEFFKGQGVEELIMAGKIQHHRIFTEFKFDLRTAKLVFILKDRRADSILGAVADEFARDGLTVVDSTKFLRSCLPQPGQLGKKRLSRRQKNDLELGTKVAKTHARFDIGQTIVMKKGVVVALEGVEGTDSTIRRGAELSGDGVIVVKVSKPHQDFRFDVPVVGLHTFEVLREVKASCLAIEAGRTLFFQQEQSLRIADKNRIAVVALDMSQENL